MAWPTWNQAAIAALLAVVAAYATRGRGSRAASAVNPSAREFAGVAALYALWRVARELPLDSPEGAIDRARWIWDFQRTIHLPSELTLQRWVLEHDRIAQWTNWYYGAIHVPALLVFLVWLWVRHRDQYPHVRNGLIFLTAWCLIIRFIRVAPPRFLPDLGFIDLSTRYGFSIYGPVGTGVSDQFAAMPSIHVGWAAVVGFGMLAVTASPWRWLGMVHLVLTMLVVAATGNHWWLDGIVAIALLGIGLWLDTAFRRRFGEHPTAEADDLVLATS